MVVIEIKIFWSYFSLLMHLSMYFIFTDDPDKILFDKKYFLVYFIIAFLKLIHLALKNIFLEQSYCIKQAVLIIDIRRSDFNTCFLALKLSIFTAVVS